jgi:hypothetical protein
VLLCLVRTAGFFDFAGGRSLLAALCLLGPNQVQPDASLRRTGVIHSGVLYSTGLRLPLY